MNILLVNIAHPAIGSRLAGEHLPPLGLLAVGGPLLDAGHSVRLIDGDHDNTPVSALADEIAAARPDALLPGHSGSTPAQPILDELTRLVRPRCPETSIVLGGVFPTFHWADILRSQPQYDYIVRGEGEAVTLALITALARGEAPAAVRGIAFRQDGRPVCTAAGPPIDLDEWRVGWELMAGRNYTYYGGGRAVLYQFSRGCPYACTYCGQNRFWRQWRHRDPERAAAELARLHRDMGVRVVNLADEDPAADQAAWRAFLEALVSRRLNLKLVGSIRADHIVRDADFLHLYREAGCERFLLGIESYNARTLKNINKMSSRAKDREAIRLLRRHGIIAMATYAVGFGDERLPDFLHTLCCLLRYDPDQIQFVYATPHRWTPYYETVRNRKVVQADQRCWDYRHQVLALEHVPPWLVILCVKLMEVIMQARPRAIFRLFFQRDRRLRAAMAWYSRIGRRVWFWELWQFFLVLRRPKGPLTVREFWERGAQREER